MKATRIMMALLIFGLAGLFFVSKETSISQSGKQTYKDYTEFLKDVEDGKVDKVEYSDNSERMRVYLLNEETSKMSYEERQEYRYPADEAYITEYPAYFDFRKDLLGSGVRLEITDMKTGNALAKTFFQIITLVSCFGLMFSALPNLMMGMKGNTAIVPEKTDVTFKDIIGLDEIMDDIEFITAFIKNQDLGKKVGAKAPKGLLLCGEPGVGKTHVARAMATEADVKFLYVNSSNVIELYAGMGAKRIRSIFAQARKCAPCIVFFDEIDAIGGKRGTGGGAESEYHQVLNALLQELDGIQSRRGVFVIAATNLAESLDPALVRAGRFDRHIIIPKPKDWKARYALATYFAKKYRCVDDIDLASFAKQCSGFTGADIEAVLNQASLIAAKRDTLINEECINEAFENMVFKGSRTKDKMDELSKDREVVAYHEAGHAVMSLLEDIPVERISVIGNTSGVGGAVFNSDALSKLITKNTLIKKIKIAYAGRASEEIKFESVSIGASNDIEQATGYLVDYVEKYGFDTETGLINASVLGAQDIVNMDRFARVSELSKGYYKDTVEKLDKNYYLVEGFAEKLLEKETMSDIEIYDLYETLLEDKKHTTEA